MIPAVRADAVPSGAFVLDVRESDEWLAGHAPGSHHVPMMEVPARLAELPTDRDVLVVCRVGQRSAQVVAYLKHTGWDNVWNLDGGLAAWEAAGQPVVRDDGSAGYVA
jgi:rhodanese-related sulfurtransferase